MRNELNRASRGHAIVTLSLVATSALSLVAWPYQGHAAQAAVKGKPDNLRARTDWAAYNGGVTGDHYSSLNQITTDNVQRMKEVWRFDAGSDGGVQTNPLVVERALYGYDPTLQVFALDGATGKQLWQFNFGIIGRQPSRGFTYWSDGKESRLFAYIMNFLYALDPATGKPIKAFGENGRLDLRKDLGSDYTQNTVALTTPGVLYNDLLILGFRAPETNPAPHGDIRAYNVRTGKLAWSFHTIPHPGENGYKTCLKVRGGLRVRPTTGQACRSISREASRMCRRAPRCRTSMVRIESVTIFLLTLCSHSTPEQAKCFGTSKVCTTIFGTGISRLPPHW